MQLHPLNALLDAIVSPAPKASALPAWGWALLAAVLALLAGGALALIRRARRR